MPDSEKVERAGASGKAQKELYINQTDRACRP